MIKWRKEITLVLRGEKIKGDEKGMTKESLRNKYLILIPFSKVKQLEITQEVF